MKKIILLNILALLVSASATAKVDSIKKWSGLKIGQIYQSDINLILDLSTNAEKNIPKNSEFKLIESSELNMIKVRLHKFHWLNCLDENHKEVELTLIKSNAMKGTVGVNLTKDCIVEVFIEKKDYNTVSFFK